MTRLHIHISVQDLSESISFYSTLFNAAPTIEKKDYAKWRLTEPAVNFAISHRKDNIGIDHLGIQVDSDEALETIATRLKDADLKTAKQYDTSCCYAQSNKHWVLDPQGIAWETFHTLKDIPLYSGKPAGNEETASSQDTDDKKEATCCTQSLSEQEVDPSNHKKCC
jgi:catechol 2,3-dioxygenase-like lactoylglutathione lyase family enzyme